MKDDEQKQLVKHRVKEIVSTEILDSALANLTEEQAQQLSGKAAEEALRLQAKSREQMMDGETARRETLDHIDSWDQLHKEGRTMRHNMTTSMKTGSGDRKIESKTGATCFVATCAFEDHSHPTVEALRIFRDTKLVKSRAGLSFSQWYYKNGPAFAAALDGVSFLKPIVRTTLTLLVTILPKQ